MVYKQNFCIKWSQWKNAGTIMPETVQHCRPTTSATTISESTDQRNKNIVVDVISTVSTSTLILESILNSNPYGISVIESFRAQNKLDENSRKLLCDAVLHNCIEK